MAVVINYELKKFIKRLLDFYPPDNDVKLEIDNFAQEYYNTIQAAIEKSKQEYDYDALMEWVKRKYTYKTTPTIPVILNLLPRAEKRKNMPRSNDEGKIFVIILSKIDKETGERKRRFEEYVICNGVNLQCNTTTLVKKYRERYENVQVRMFPEGTVILGAEGRVIRPDSDKIEILLPEKVEEKF